MDDATTPATLTIAPEPPRQDEVIALLRASDAFAEARYPPESRHLLDVTTLEKPEIRFFVARLDGQAVGCGALMRHADGTGELKRMFVSDAARGRRIGEAILKRIEDEARAQGIGLLRLETGVLNDGALALYRRCGYRDCGPFASYTGDKWTLFMEKELGRA
jgi:putative acetyltransferase